MGLFGSPKIDGEELKQCLAYFEASIKVTSFQTKEAELYNNVLVKYLDSIKDDPSAAFEVQKAGRRLSLSADEVLKRHEAIKNVPSPAAQSHFAWYTAFLAFKTWASASAAAADALAEGKTPNRPYIQQLVKEMQKSEQIATEEAKKFVKRLKTNAEVIGNIVEHATSLNPTDSWEPQTKAYTQSEEDEAKGQLAIAKLKANPGDWIEAWFSDQNTIKSPRIDVDKPAQTTSRNLDEPKQHQITLLKDEDWSVIDGEFCRVINFTPSSYIENGKIIKTISMLPYCSIDLECAKLPGIVCGFITHKIDFTNLWNIFKERGVDKNEEVLIIWTTKNYSIKMTSWFSKIMPKVKIYICARNAFERLKAAKNPEDISKALGDYQEIKPDVMLQKK